MLYSSGCVVVSLWFLGLGSRRERVRFEEIEESGVVRRGGLSGFVWFSEGRSRSRFGGRSGRRGLNGAFLSMGKRMIS